MSLVEQPWYWGKVDKTVVSQVLSTLQDGSFIVRDSSSPGNYTLTLKHAGQLKLVKIHVHGNKCGFSKESLTHNSIASLIKAHRNQSLKVYNDLLDTSLLYPVSREILDGKGITNCPPKTKPRAISEKSSFLGVPDSDGHLSSASSTCSLPSSIASLSNDPEWIVRLGLEKLRICQIAVDRSARLFDSVHAEIQRADGLHHKFTTALGTLDKKICKLEEIIETQTSCLLEDHDEMKLSALKSNKEVVERSVSRLRKERGAIMDRRTRLAAVMEQMREESILAKQRLVREQSNRKAAVAELNALKVPQHKVVETSSLSQEMLSKETTHVSMLLADLSLSWDPIQYLVNDASKEAAQNILESAQKNMAKKGIRSTDGLFLIRPSASHPEKLALSIHYSGRISHCLIEQTDLGWGFDNGGLYFVTIGDFVRYYSHATLEEHNKEIRTRLTNPALQFATLS